MIKRASRLKVKLQPFLFWKDMGRITALQAARKHKKRVNLFLDGRFALSVDAEVAVKEGLRIGQDLPDDRLEALKGSDSFQHCLDAANKFLSYRPRSEAELIARLKKHGFEDGIIKAVLDRLRQYGLVDDTAFARFWQENRSVFSPRSSRLTGYELRRKGISSDIIENMVSEMDDEENAYRAASGRINRLPVGDYRAFRQRLGDFLRRRGFGYDVISRTVEKMWKEYESSA